MNFKEFKNTQLFQRIKNKIITNTRRTSMIRPSAESKIDDLLSYNRKIHMEFSNLLQPLRENRVTLNTDELNKLIADLTNLEKKIDYIESYFQIELNIGANPEY